MNPTVYLICESHFGCSFIHSNTFSCFRIRASGGIDLVTKPRQPYQWSPKSSRKGGVVRLLDNGCNSDYVDKE